MPQLEDDLRAISEASSQTGPSFRTTRLYRRLTAAEARCQLLERGYSEKDIPSERSLCRMLGTLGFKPRRVQGAGPWGELPIAIQAGPTQYPDGQMSRTLLSHPMKALESNLLRFNLGPAGGYEGLLLETQQGVAQIYFAPDQASNLVSSLPADAKLSIKGTVSRLNYAKHGEVDGAVLDTDMWIGRKCNALRLNKWGCRIIRPIKLKVLQDDS